MKNLLKWLWVALWLMANAAWAVAGWSAPVNISDSPNHFSVGATVAMDEEGKLHSAYVDFLDSDRRLYYVTNQSGSWQRERIPVNFSTNYLQDPIVNVLSAENLISIVFHSDDSLYEVIKPIKGGGWSVPQKLAGGSHNAWHVGTVKDIYGGLLTVYSKIWFGNGDAGGLYSRYRPKGGAWGPEQLIMVGEGGRFPAAAWVTQIKGPAWGGTANGGFWVTADINSRSWISYRPPGTNTTWTPRIINNKWAEYGGSFGGRAAMSPNGEIAVAFIQDIGGPRWFEPFVTFSSNEAATWLRPVNIAEHPALDRKLQMVYDSAGTLHVVWERFRSTTSSQADVYYRTRTNGVWSAAENLTPEGGGIDGANGFVLIGNQLFLIYGCGRADRGLLDLCLISKTVGGATAPRPVLTESPDPYGWIRNLDNNRVKGWAYDPDAQGKPIQVEIRVDGKTYQTVTAGLPSDSKLVSLLGLPHANFGFDLELTGLTPGKHKVEAIAKNVGAGRDIVIFGSGNEMDYKELKPVDAYGAFQDLSDALYGWAYDPNNGVEQIKVRVFVDGQQVKEVKANVDKYDLKGDPRVPSIKYGFKIPLSDLGTLSAGTHSVEVYAVDVPTGKLIKLPGGPRTLVTSEPLKPLNAQVVSLNVPRSMAPGKTYDVTIVYKNTGSRTWKKVDKYRLGFQNPIDNSRWGLTRVDLTEETVAPSQSGTFHFTAKAPGTTGTYVFQVQMLREGEAWFGDLSEAVPVTVSSGATAAPTLTLNRVPSPMIAGQNNTATWSSTNATSVSYNCTSTGTGFAGTGTLPTVSGSATSVASAAWVGYPSTCVWTATGPGGSTSVTEILTTKAADSGGNTGSGGAPAARLVSMNVPATMKAGENYEVTVVFRNTGGTVWTRSGKYRLGFLSPQDNTIWGLGRVELGSDTIAPGQEAQFKFTVKAPSAGARVFQVRMLQEGVAWFGDMSEAVSVNVTPAVTSTTATTTTTTATTTTTTKPNAGPPAAQLVSMSVPTTMKAGQSYEVTVVYRNTGGDVWTKSAKYRLGFQSPQDNTIWGLGRVELGSSETIAPGQEARFKFTVKAPSAGTRVFQVRMLQEGVTWFGDFSEARSIKVEN